MSLICWFMQLQVRHMTFSQNFIITFLKAQLFFTVVAIFVDSLLPPLNMSIFYQIKAAVPFSHSLAHGVVPVHFHWCNSVLTGFFQRSKQVI